MLNVNIMKHNITTNGFNRNDMAGRFSMNDPRPTQQVKIEGTIKDISAVFAQSFCYTIHVLGMLQ